MRLRAGAPLTHSQSDIHVGRDGWLFLVRGSNEVARQYRRTPRAWWRRRLWRRRIEERAERCRRLGIRFVQVVAPDKLTLLSHLCAQRVVNPALSPAVRLARLIARSSARDAYVDIVEPMRADAAALFMRTDTHWTYAGCLVAYRLICAALEVAPRDDLLDRPYQDHEQPADLGIKMRPPVTEKFRVYTTIKDARQHAINARLVAFRAADGRSPLRATGADYRNDTAHADPRRVLIFGDSYAHFDPIWLTGMLAETFRDVRFVWSTNVDWAYVEEVRPDIMICEMAERFMAGVADDRFDLRATLAKHLAQAARGDAIEP